MKQVHETAAVSHELALEFLRAAMDEGATAGVAVAVAVCDPGMTLVAYARADDTTPHSAETSRRKAQTSASTRRATGWMEGDFGVVLPLGSGNLLTNIKGGYPLFVNGRFLGGVGVAGGPPDVDAEIATRALRRISADPVP